MESDLSFLAIGWSIFHQESVRLNLPVPLSGISDSPEAVDIASVPGISIPFFFDGNENMVRTEVFCLDYIEHAGKYVFQFGDRKFFDVYDAEQAKEKTRDSQKQVLFHACRYGDETATGLQNGVNLRNHLFCIFQEM